jgi:GAF domain-containing protein
VITKELAMGDNEREERERVVVDAAANPNMPLQQMLVEVANALHDQFDHYTGVYLYLLEGDVLVLAAYRGRPTEHVRIPVGEGICGRAARVKQTVTVDDVNKDPDYIACSLETVSETVVPIMRGEKVLGEIDIDSDKPAAFGKADRLFLDKVAGILAGAFQE